ncbi:AAA family ATPase, partial [Klebsiella pneumoniae]|uniref:AAA family ATPase n=2 Tax=Enterobacteriaceae TaxID=543 RepID=UPI0038621B01|nr:hypothetical protein [Klebsiella pneumoniae]
LNDVNQKIASIERSSHASILAIYQKTLNQVNAFNHFASKNIAFLEDLLEHIQLTKPESFITDDELFNTQNEIEAKNKITVLQQKIDSSITEFNGSIDATIIEIRELIQWFDSSSLKQDISNHQTQYTNLISTLQANGVNNPNEYEALINSRKQIKERLDKIEIDEKTIKTKKTSITESYNKLVELRKELTSRRRQFLVDINNDNTNFKVSVDFCGDKQFLESSFRNAIDKKDSTFSNEIYNEDGNGFLNVFNAQIKEISEDMDAINQKIRVLKNEFLNKESNTILDVRLSKRFSDFKNDLTDEVITSLICWFPSDAITVKYNDGRRFKDLSQGSAGQKAATVLAFLLSYGDDPIILDQPEDDLDNQLVYELIVKKIKESKNKRQIIIVTHNPNIVVNGDSELVISLSQQSGTTDFLSLGGLQEREVRQTICDIMEGGKDAFSQRYRRIVTA